MITMWGGEKEYLRQWGEDILILADNIDILEACFYCQIAAE